MALYKRTRLARSIYQFLPDHAGASQDEKVILSLHEYSDQILMNACYCMDVVIAFVVGFLVTFRSIVQISFGLEI